MPRRARWLWSLRRELAALWRIFRHPRTPKLSKLMVVVAAAYLISPLDLVPDWLIPLAGFVDDAIIVPLLFWLALRPVPRDVLAECRGSGDADR